ncbi:MAG: hypothetical protein GY759_06460 [Chloroflexi bacterium]|nr:hypothetical protein [Chloroflexota bacterium]
MNGIQRLWLRLQGGDCYSCHHCQVFRSNGDGQVSRLHSFCRNPDSAHAGGPIPDARWCDDWQRAEDGRKRKPEDIDGAGLTA